MPQPERSRSDAELVQELAVVLRDERRRAPADLLVILGAAIVLGAGACLLIGTWVGGGTAQVVLLNLSTELMGAVVTVILIGALWQRFQHSALGSVDALTRAVEASGQRGLTDAERRAFERVIEIHQRTERARPVVRQLRALAFTVSHRNELAALERVIKQAPPA
jgi:hypothetical protein